MAARAKPKKSRKKSGPTIYADDNDRVFLTSVPLRWRAGCHATTDPSDRAHKTRDTSGFLVPAAVHGRPSGGLTAKPRRYHISQLVGYCLRVNEETGDYAISGGVGIDSSFDDWWEWYQILTRAGIPLGGLRHSHQEDDLERMDLYMPPRERLRDRIEQKTTQSKMTDSEKSLEDEADQILMDFGEVL